MNNDERNDNMKENLNYILYDDAEGVFSKLRKGNFEKDEEKLTAISNFVKDVKSKISANTCDIQDILDVVTIIFTLLQYTNADWTRKFASDLYLILISKGE